MRPPRLHSARLFPAILLGASFVASGAMAQGTKRPLTPDDWDRWRSIVAPTISRDGRWVAYSLHPQVGDGELVVRSTAGTTEYRVPRGFVGRPQMVAGAQGGDSASAVPPAQLTADSRHAIALTYAPKADYDRARQRSRRPQDQPRASLAIVDLADGRVTTVPRVRSFRLPRDAGGWVAYLLEPADSAARPVRDSTPGAAAPGVAAATPGGVPRPVGDSAARGRRREYGNVLVLRELASGREVRIDDVTSYAFEDSARWLGYTTASRTPARDGAYLRALASCAAGDCAERVLASGAGEYRQLAFDRAGEQVAFISTREEAQARTPRYALHHAMTRGGGPAAVVVRAGALGDSVVVAESGRVEFVRSGGAILFGVAPPPLDSIPADSLADKAVFDLWHWRDPRLQTQQRAEAGRERNRSFAALYHLPSRRVVRLASDSLPTVQVSEDGRVALASTNVPYSIEQMWGEGGFDLWLLDATTGTRRRVAERVQSPAQLSPGGRHVVWFHDRRWWAQPTTGPIRPVDLTGALRGVRFEQEEHDTPDDPGAYGVAGWTTGDRSLLVYDRYDVWELDPTGQRAPRMVTDSVGRREHIAFRVAALDPDQRFVDPTQPILLRAFDDDTKASGFWRDRVSGDGDPERVVMADASFGLVQKARHAEQYLVTRGTFVDFPNLHVGPSLQQLTRISDANPQQAEVRWGSVELVSWVSSDGVPLQGLLYKPADFDPSKQYPMVAYFYERLSDNLHQYVPPGGRNVINPTHYASNGYLIFEPDIVYEEGYPGPSAMKAIVPGVQMLLARGYVDPQRLGLQGQSWGGYQTAYMITQTTMFRAAMAGAPVANMFSAYGGIRWQSGMNRAFQYEKGQSRIGGSIWESPLRYLENSPLFWAD
ncbi:MAG TPA: prolyl oligopeptidase family serine peptidase, partial [Gemmatimonadaceae bacterium]|nr:prolyl oligopeptidase family serine peptidase [Gemmatimonadaceae bacterium]